MPRNRSLGDLVEARHSGTAPGTGPVTPESGEPGSGELGWLAIALTFSSKSDRRDDHVDDLDPDERHEDAAQAVDQQVTAQQVGGADRAVLDPLQGQRNQRYDDQGVEDDRGQDGALRARQT